MLFTTVKEVNAHLSNSSYSVLNDIQGALISSEESFLKPYLGTKLYDALTAEYKELADKAVLQPMNETVKTPWMKLAYMCQRAILFDFMYSRGNIDNIRLTTGGGLNRMSSGNFDPADTKEIEAYRESCLREAHKSIDNILIFLEADALKPATDGGNIFTAKWKESEWYALTAERLINTAVDFSSHVDIFSSREKFVRLMPDISFCEDTRLRTLFGDEFITQLIAKVADGSATAIQKAFYKKLQKALAVCVEARNKMFTRKEATGDATLLLAMGADYVRAHQDQFTGFIEDSPLYTPPVVDPVEPIPDPNPCAYTNDEPFQNNRKGNAIFVTPLPGC